MKNILAENLLRFGAKNLSESDRTRLQEQTPPEAAADPRVAIIQQWADKPVTKTGKFAAVPQDAGKPDHALKLDGKGFVEFQLRINPPLVSIYKTRVTFAKYKYNFTNDTWLSSSGDLKSGNIQPYTWAQGNEWSQSDYDVSNIMKDMEISVNNPFIKALKLNLGQPTPGKPATQN